jgi:hypothetical protein
MTMENLFEYLVWFNIDVLIISNLLIDYFRCSEYT